MLLLYNFGIRLYTTLITIFALWNQKARDWVEGRREIPTDLARWKKGQRKVVWVHAASLGEFEMGMPVFEQLIASLEADKWQLVVTFFSPSGYNAKKKYPKASLITYLPIDTAKNASYFLDAIQPDIALFVKYEFWHHMLKALKQRGVLTYVVGARFYPKQIFFKSYGKWFRRMLTIPNKVFVQRKEDLELVKSITGNFEIGGDSRYDRVHQIAKASRSYPEIEIFKKNYPLVMGGSTWESEDQLLIELIKKHALQYKFLIAPHELKESTFNKYEELKVGKVLRFSQLSTHSEEEIANALVILVDTIGHLSSLYKYGDVAFVGGGFGKGLHNILEPLAFNVPVIFGTDTDGFLEAKEALEAQVAAKVETYGQFEKAIAQFTIDKPADFDVQIDKYMRSKRGSSQMIVDRIIADLN